MPFGFTTKKKIKFGRNFKMDSNGKIVFDIETQNNFSVGKDTRSLKVSLVGTYFYKTNQYRIYYEKDLPDLFRVMEKAELLIGYNIKGFDLPVLNNYYPGDLTKFPVLDLMEEIVSKLGFRVSLNAVAQATLGTQKTGQGAQAIVMWREGRIEELKKYCLQDVKLTKELYEYGKKHGILKYQNKLGAGEAKVNFSRLTQSSPAINLTLPL